MLGCFLLVLYCSSTWNNLTRGYLLAPAVMKFLSSHSVYNLYALRFVVVFFVFFLFPSAQYYEDTDYFYLLFILSTDLRASRTYWKLVAVWMNKQMNAITTVSYIRFMMFGLWDRTGFSVGKIWDYSPEEKQINWVRFISCVTLSPCFFVFTWLQLPWRLMVINYRQLWFLLLRIVVTRCPTALLRSLGCLDIQTHRG